MTYSLWLRPQRRSAQRLKRTIDSLAMKLGTSAFPPHVTVTSGMPDRPAETDLLALAHGRRALALKPLRFAHSNSKYQCLKIVLRKNRALNELRAQALSELGGVRTHAPYHAHVSLLYARLSAKRRQALLKQLPADILSRCEASVLQLVYSEGHERRGQILEEIPLVEKA